MHYEIVLHGDRKSRRACRQAITPRHDSRENVQTFLAGLSAALSVGINVGQDNLSSDNGGAALVQDAATHRGGLGLRETNGYCGKYDGQDKQGFAHVLCS